MLTVFPPGNDDVKPIWQVAAAAAGVLKIIAVPALRSPQYLMIFRMGRMGTHHNQSLSRGLPPKLLAPVKYMFCPLDASEKCLCTPKFW